MRRSAILGILTVVLLYISAMAQDPGAPDSLIIETQTFYLLPESTALFLSVYAVTDDSVYFLNLPLSLRCRNCDAFFSRTVWRGVIRNWDEYYDTLVDYSNNSLRQVAWCDLGGADNPPLFTLGQRELILELRIYIWNCWGLFGGIDVREWNDPLNGPITFGLNSANDFRPVFISGGLLFNPIDEGKSQLPDKLSLSPNYPNPFNSSTTISYGIPSESEVTLEIYDILGKRIASLVNQQQQPGNYQVSWNATDMPSGAYFARLKAGEQSQTMKMILMK